MKGMTKPEERMTNESRSPNFLGSCQLSFECRFGHDLICLSDYESELLPARGLYGRRATLQEFGRK
jgi:hypothetical protein